MRSLKDFKTIVIFAGPNGSGKTTVINAEIENGWLIPDKNINPDYYEKIEPICFIEDSTKRSEAARDEAEKDKQILMENGDSFSFETVFSHPSKLDFIDEAKENDYIVQVVYITTNNPEINVKRVAERVRKGGHDVSIDKILNRYNRSMDLLNEIIIRADEIKVFDNSTLDPIEVFCKDFEGNMTITSKEIEWVKEKIEKPLLEKGYKLKIMKE